MVRVEQPPAGSYLCSDPNHLLPECVAAVNS